MTHITQWKPAAVVCVMSMLGLGVATASHGWTASHESRLRFDTAIELPGIVLPAGTYSFDLADMPDLVVVRSADRLQTFYVGFTNTVRRPADSANGISIAFRNAPADAPAPVSVWYPAGGSIGHAFRY